MKERKKKMDFMVIDKETMENITGKKRWLLETNGDVKYIDNQGDICSLENAIAIEPESYSTLLAYKRKSKPIRETDKKVYRILVRCVDEHYIEFETSENFSQKEIEDISRKILQGDENTREKYDPEVCYNVCNSTSYFYDAENKKGNNTEANSLSEKEFVEKHCKSCGTQRCEGIGTEWFEGCHYRNELIGYEKKCR